MAPRRSRRAPRNKGRSPSPVFLASKPIVRVLTLNSHGIPNPETLVPFVLPPDSGSDETVRGLLAGNCTLFA